MGNLSHLSVTGSTLQAMSFIDVALGLLLSENRVLICRRKHSDPFGGYWEFPGGKCLPGEAPADCAVRELKEELGIESHALRPLPVIEHQYPAISVRLHPFICELLSGEPTPLAALECAWADAAALAQLKFPEANVTLIADLRELLQQAT